MKSLETSRDIPSLDGLRAASILLVLVGHESARISGVFPKIPAILLLTLAHTGVLVFFVISGFLITTLLLRELQSTGRIELTQFYVRPAFRIFPAFYVYLAVVLVLAITGFVHAQFGSFLWAGAYLENYNLGSSASFIGVQHTWSLSLEEQFYAFWPVALLSLGRRRALTFAVAIICLSPLSRVLTFFALAPNHRASVVLMLHSGVDTVMFGCVLALLWKSRALRRFMQSWISAPLAACSVAFLLVFDPLLRLRLHGGYVLALGLTLNGVAICVLVLYMVQRPDTIGGRVLNYPAVRHLGVISCSLYLWQNIILGETGRFALVAPLVLLACAEASYWLVERPSLRVRDRVLRSWESRRAQLAETV